MGGQPLERGGGGDLFGRLVVQLYQPLGADHALLGIAAALHAVGHAVTGNKIGHVGPDLFDNAGTFHAQDDRQVLHRIAAGPLLNIDVVQPDRGMPETHLAHARSADGDVLPAHGVRPTRLVNSNCLDDRLAQGCFLRIARLPARPPLSTGPDLEQKQVSPP